VRILRWTQNGLPVVAVGTQDAFFSTYSAIMEHPEAINTNAATLVGKHCIETCMNDRSALEFTETNIGVGPWQSIYNKINSGIAGDSMPWRPIVFLIEASNTFDTCSFEFVVKGTVEVCPPVASFLSRMTISRSIINNDEENWWRLQKRISTTPLVAVRDTNSRTVAGFVGKHDTGFVAAKQEYPSRAPKGNTTINLTTTTGPPRLRGNDSGRAQPGPQYNRAAIKNAANAARAGYRAARQAQPLLQALNAITGGRVPKALTQGQSLRSIGNGELLRRRRRR